ncbi:hypothetical protein PO124_13960 [Bacillus licheniformis]|nr:hypothetical protein [Bacillus licheniformis]
MSVIFRGRRCSDRLCRARSVPRRTGGAANAGITEFTVAELTMLAQMTSPFQRTRAHSLKAD